MCCQTCNKQHLFVPLEANEKATDRAGNGATKDTPSTSTCSLRTGMEVLYIDQPAEGCRVFLKVIKVLLYNGGHTLESHAILDDWSEGTIILHTAAQYDVCSTVSIESTRANNLLNTWRMMFIFFFPLKSEVDHWSNRSQNLVYSSASLFFSSLLCHTTLLNPLFTYPRCCKDRDIVSSTSFVLKWVTEIWRGPLIIFLSHSALQNKPCTQPGFCFLSKFALCGLCALDASWVCCCCVCVFFVLVNKTVLMTFFLFSFVMCNVGRGNGSVNGIVWV